MGEHVNTPLMKGLGWATAIIMAAAVVAMIITA
jgi:hypothetical protein